MIESTDLRLPFGSNGRMGKRGQTIRRFFVVTAVVTGLLAASAYWQRERVLARVVAAISRHSPYPFQVRSLAVSWWPVPALGLDGVVLRSGQGRAGAYAERVRYRPGLCWLGGDPCGELAIDGLAVDAGFVDLVRNDLENAPPSQPGLPLDRLIVDGLMIRGLASSPLGPYRLVADLEPRGRRIGRLRLRRTDGRLGLTLVPTDGGGRFRVEAREWRWPFGAAIYFDRLEASGQWTADGLVVERLGARGYNGGIDGQGRLDWRDGLVLKARLDGQGLRIAPIVAVFGGRGVDGRFSGNLRLESSARDVRGLLRGIQVSGPFEVDRGRVVSDARLAPIAVDHLSARGRVDRNGLSLSAVRIEAYDGRISARARVGWQAGWRVEGRAEFAGIDSEPLLGCFIGQPVLGGRLSGNARFAMRAPGAAGLMQSAVVDADLRVDDGAFYRVDLEQARQGRTDFDRLRTRLRIAGGDRRLTVTELVSDRLNASGRLHVSQHGGIAGGFDVSLRYTASLVSFPVTIAGEVGDPEVRPGGSALLGGAIGTGVLGPGIGTVVGARIGQFLGSLVASDDDAAE